MNTEKISFKIFLVFACVGILFTANGQEVHRNSYGEGISIRARDRSFQSQFYGWVHMGPTFSIPARSTIVLSDLNTNFTLYRARFGSKGYVFDPSFTYHFQLALSGAELASDPSSPNNTQRPILDAYAEWEAFSGFSVSLGQRFLPTHKEGATFASNLQFNDRSLLFSKSGADRDQGIFIYYKTPNDRGFAVNVLTSATMGEGRDIGINNLGGLCYNSKVEILPFGRFTDGGASVADLKKEESFMLNVGAGFEFNDNAVREFSHKGKFVEVSRDMEGYFADLLMKYQGFSLLAEYYESFTKLPVVYNNGFLPLTRFNSGAGYNIQSGYVFNTNWEIKGRFTTFKSKEVLNRDHVNSYTIGFTKYITNQTFKVQTEFTYLENLTTSQNSLQLGAQLAVGF